MPLNLVAMTTNTILSVYMQGRGNNEFDYLSSLKPRVVKIQDAKQSEVDRIKSLTPGSFIIDRIYVDDGQVSADILADPEAAAEKHHGMILERGLSGVDYYQIQNEQHQKPPELKLLNRYYLRLMELCVSTGHRTTVIDCSVGNLHVDEAHPGDWEYVFPTLDYAQKHGFVVNCHQYSRGWFWNPAYDNDWFLHRLEHTAMPVLDNHGFQDLLYVVGEFGLTQLLSIYDGEVQKPGGWQIWRTHDEYRQDTINVMGYLLQWSDRILGYCCYLTHANSPWETHEMIEMNKDLANHYSANPQSIKPLHTGGTEPPDEVLFKARVTPSTLNVRSGPGTNHPVVGRVNDGDIVDVIEVVSVVPSDWWGIVKGSLSGYSSSFYMERIDSGGDLEQRVSTLEAQMAVVSTATASNTSDIEKLIAYVTALTSIVHDIDIRVDGLEDRVTALEGGVVPPTDAILSPSIDHMSMSVQAGGPYKIRDCFTTYRGNWDVSNSIYSVTQHAEQRYHRSNTGECGGGGDHHIFAAVVDEHGEFISGVPIIFERTDQAGGHIYHTEVHETRSCGWANLPVSHPAFWRVKVQGGSEYMTPFSMPNADGSMPGREHVSLFTVFR